MHLLFLEPVVLLGEDNHLDNQVQICKGKSLQEQTREASL